MKIKDYKCKCGCNDFFFADKGNQKGIYCTKCGKWLKWADKDEKNLIHCLYTDEEIAKSFIEDVEAVKDQLPCGQIMEFPKTFDDFARDYGFKDDKEIYTNGIDLISVYRVKQWLEHIKSSTTKNDLAVSSGLEKNSKKLEKDFDESNCIDREEILKAMDTWDKFGYSARYGLERLDKDDKGFVPYVKYEDMVNCVKNMSSVTLQEPRKGHWIETAEEYYKAINEKGGGVNENTDFFTDDIACSECLAKFSVIDNEAERFDFCPNCGADMRDEEV